MALRGRHLTPLLPSSASEYNYFCRACAERSKFCGRLPELVSSTGCPSNISFLDWVRRAPNQYTQHFRWPWWGVLTAGYYWRFGHGFPAHTATNSDYARALQVLTGRDEASPLLAVCLEHLDGGGWARIDRWLGGGSLDLAQANRLLSARESNVHRAAPSDYKPTEAEMSEVRHLINRFDSLLYRAVSSLPLSSPSPVPVTSPPPPVKLTTAPGRLSSPLNNGLGWKPPMGYSTWNDCGSTPNSSWVRRTADYLLSSGLAELGWRQVNVDEGWMLGRGASPPHQPIEDRELFPEGMGALGVWLHGRGLGYGLYSSRGSKQCDRPEYRARCLHTPPNPASDCAGSLGHFKVDGEWIAAQGADYFKFDSCGAPDWSRSTAFGQYAEMRDVLNSTGRAIFFSLCGWQWWYAPPDPSRQYLGGGSLGNSFRVYKDGKDWAALSQAVNVMAVVGRWSRPGGWADPDLLIGPWCGIDRDQNFCGQTDLQARTQFSLWAIFPAPLLLSQNLLAWSDYAKETYSNREVIALNQQSHFVAPASRVAGSNLSYPCSAADVDGGCSNVWARPLSDVAFVLVFVNNAPQAANVACDHTCFGAAFARAAELGMGRGGEAIAATTARSSRLGVRDLWSHSDLPQTLSPPFHLEVSVAGAGGCRLLRISPLS